MVREEGDDKTKTVEPPGAGAIGSSGLLGIDGLVPPPRRRRNYPNAVPLSAPSAGAGPV